ncbi:RNA-guided endonuclease TnpB family protein [Methylosinus sp. PW1]|uniref:RNA-guided endonuclease InsQ/TnpB family protein n=1 Tax=Methylosinus sp. PW1 TaxID=107636 RepID=UPI00068F23EF|nr:RNA-guided endonuclease TnpB family protein [Methylosinus sp. PW1]
MINRGFRYRLDPTDEQELMFRKFAGVCRTVYNAALYQREAFWKQHLRTEGKHVSYAGQCLELTDLRAEFDWIREVSATCEQQALRDLDKAFQRFFDGISGYPTPRRKGENDSFRFQGRDIEVEKLNRNWSRVWLPKIGWVRFRDTRPMIGKLKNVTVSLDPLGWHVSFAREIEHEAPANIAPAVGIDRGVANSIAMSSPLEGEQFFSVGKERLAVLDRRRRKHQRDLSRRRRGSKRCGNARKRIAAVAAKGARVREHFNHVQTTRIVRRFGTVCIEDLNIASMTASAKGTVEEPGKNVAQKAGLNRSILEQGWGQFEEFLTYKLAASGGVLVKVDPRNTSRKCSNCGHIDARNRESQASFRCVECGHEAHADVNAAINILQAGTRPSVRAPARRRESRKAA